MTSYAMGEVDRRLANMVRIGTVAQFDPEQGVRVDVGELVTGWLPIGTKRAGKQRSWNPMDIGEEVVVVSPSGELSQGVVVCSINQLAHPANGDKQGLWRESFDDGTVLEYDQDTGGLRANVASTGSIALTVGESAINVTPSAISITAGGNTLAVDASGIKHNGTDIGNTHKHAGSPTAPNGPVSNTGAPTA